MVLTWQGIAMYQHSGFADAAMEELGEKKEEAFQGLRRPTRSPFYNLNV